MLLVGFSAIVWVGVCLNEFYIWWIALASLRGTRRLSPSSPQAKTGDLPHAARHGRFAIAIPAHDEENVIGATVGRMQKLDYPHERYDIFVAADNCHDRTAELAREQGAICYERVTKERSGKGAALAWLFERIFEHGDYDAVAVFDADTQVDPNFLRVMDERLQAGAQVVQGRHVISNPHQGWFPGLAWAMMTIDCRLYSQGRANLGFSARHMGDSICFDSRVLKDLGWGSGLTEDYEFRLKLLLQGICIDYEPRAIGYGQAPVTWREAQAQRVRWARGVSLASKHYRSKLLKGGIERRDWRLIDGMLSITIPSYTMLTLISLAFLLLTLLVQTPVYEMQLTAWIILLALLFVYPFFGLALEKAPGWAYFVILIGPLYMLWRTWINLIAKVRSKNIVWVRTPHRLH